MIDQARIDEIKELPTKEAKSALVEYAQEFGIKLNKTKTVQNMIQDLETGLNELAQEPMPEQEGLSTSDILKATAELDGLVADKEVDQELLDQVQSLSNGTDLNELPSGVYVVETPNTEFKEVQEVKPEVTQPVIEHIEVVQEVLPDEPIKPVEVETQVLPKGFNPSFALIGSTPGYYTLAWWLWDWIETTPDWKNKIHECQHTRDHNILYSLVYYIQKNKSVQVRETRNSKYFTLT